MDNRVVQVPVSLLMDPNQEASAKVLWMALRLHPSAEPAELEQKTGLSRHTVQRGLGWAKPADRAAHGGPRVKVPAALLAEPRVGARAKVLYGLLQATPHFRGHGGQFTYTALCAQTKLGRNTLKRAIAELAGAEWLRVTQANQLSPIRFKLGSPALVHAQAAAAAARRRLDRAQHTGEAIMQEYLSLLIDSDEFTDNARPGFLVNPLTGSGWNWTVSTRRVSPSSSMATSTTGRRQSSPKRKWTHSACATSSKPASASTGRSGW